MMENQSEQKMSMKRKPWVPLKAYIYIWIYERYGGEPNGKENGRCNRHGALKIIRLFRVGVMGSGHLVTGIRQQPASLSARQESPQPSHPPWRA